MSYSFEFYASRTRTMSKLDKLAEQPYHDQHMIDLIKSAVDNVKDKEGIQTIFHVKANGHHHSGNDWDHTNHAIEVTPIYLETR